MTRPASIATAILLVAWSCASAGETSVSFYDDIKPLLAVHCYKCHAGEQVKAGLHLDSQTGVMKGGKSGNPAVVRGGSSQSEVIRRITAADPEERMPPKGPRLSPEEINKLKHWIDAGASWPERDDYWAFQLIKNPFPPPTRHPVRSPIDRFIGASLQAAQIEPAAEANAHTLLRRAYADLLGVPPSPDEAAAFLSDTHPHAYEKLIDRLLSDPRYGERWARHWLDLARYGESDGYEDDKVRPHAWRYRDYVIRSLNGDKPYDRFVQEQIAGDELWPDQPDSWVATGFARLGAWDGMSKEPAQQWQDFLNDATDAVGSVFLGMTVGCARCHDHKYDSITQKDYYRLQAFFSATRRETRELSANPSEPAEVRAAFERDNRELKQLRQERDAVLGEARASLETADKKVSDADVKKKAEALHPGRLSKLQAAIKKLERLVGFHEPKADAVVFVSGQSSKTHILLGGEISRRGDPVEPGFIEAIPSESNCRSSTNGRTRLAGWLTAPQHPLTARVIVNRLWQHHFGKGLVATASDFGRNGQRPTHRDLLDWVATEFVKGGYSLKRMHKLMMTSATYRRDSTPSASALEKDPEDKLLSHMPRRRLEAEAIRDSFLAVSSDINYVMGGPGVYAAIPSEVNVQLPNNDKELSWETCTDAENARRSIYIFQRRSLTFPLMDVFDVAPMNQSCAVRPETTVAPQALSLFNSQFARKAATRLALRVIREASGKRENQIAHAFQITFARKPSLSEMAQAVKFMDEQTKRRASDQDPTQSAWVDFCHALLNANEFIYLD